MNDTNDLNETQFYEFIQQLKLLLIQREKECDCEKAIQGARVFVNTAKKIFKKRFIQN